MSLPDLSTLDTARNRVGVWLANLALRITDKRYQALTKGAIAYGWEAAARDANANCPTGCARDHFPCSRKKWDLSEDELRNDGHQGGNA